LSITGKRFALSNLHNTWYSKGKENVPASAARKRMLYVVGLGVELETACARSERRL
jgi:hypothetical protein